MLANILTMTNEKSYRNSVTDACGLKIRQYILYLRNCPNQKNKDRFFLKLTIKTKNKQKNLQASDSSKNNPAEY